MNQLKLLLIGLVGLWSIFGIANGKIINCYVGTWANYRTGDGKFEPSNIDAKLCTHLSYTFFGFSDSGEFKVLDPWLDLKSGLDNIHKMMSLKKKNKNLKVLAVVGGRNFQSTPFSIMAADSSKRKVFIDSTLKFIKEHKFDGLDIDWEYPAQRGGSPADKQNFVILLKELKAALKPLKKELGIAVAAGGSSADTSYDIPEIAKHVDFINVMTYDFALHSDGIVGFNAPLSGQGNRNVESSMNYWLKKGAPASKLVLGVPFYGRTFKLQHPHKFSLGSPVTGAGKAGPITADSGYLGYNEICTHKKKWTYKWASENSVPFLHKANQFISYDNAESIELKVEFANSLNLAGVMIWSIETDDFRGKCGDKYPLLKAINKKMGNPEADSSSNKSKESELAQSSEEDSGSSEEDDSSVESVPSNPRKIKKNI